MDVSKSWCIRGGTEGGIRSGRTVEVCGVLFLQLDFDFRYILFSDGSGHKRSMFIDVRQIDTGDYSTRDEFVYAAHRRILRDLIFSR